MKIQAEVMAALRKNWHWFLIVGIPTIILGIVAIAIPFAVSIAVELIIGGVLVVGGIFKFLHAIKSAKTEGWLVDLFGSLIYLAAGVVLLLFPMEGLFTLTVVLAAFFLASGVFRIIYAVQMRQLEAWGWILASGIMALILGIIIWAGLPGDDRWVTGLIVGIDLILVGWSLIMFGLALKKIRTT